MRSESMDFAVSFSEYVSVLSPCFRSSTGNCGGLGACGRVFEKVLPRSTAFPPRGLAALAALHLNPPHS